MINRVQLEVDKFLSTLDVRLDEILGGAVLALTPAQREELHALFEEFVDTLCDLVRQGKDAHTHLVQQIVRDSVEAIISFDLDENVFFWNRGAEMTFGWTFDEIVGRNAALLWPSGSAGSFREFLGERGYFQEIERELARKGGGKIVALVSGFTIVDENGAPLGFVIVARDVTSVRALEREIRHSEKLALAGQLAAGMAHEMGTPLSIIMGNADFLLMDRAPGADGYEELEMIKEQANRITSLVQKLLTFARPGLSEREPVDLNYIAADSVKLLKKTFEAGRVHVEMDLAPSLPEIEGDIVQLEQVVLNLLVNACDALKDGDHRDNRNIRLRTRCIDSSEETVHVALECEDNGCGIKEDILDRIFEPFFTTKDAGLGSGLGLAISRRIVEEHGGVLEVQSVPGSGTVFSVIIPAQRCGVTA
ncbi:MAG: PAS domain S-box protein [Chlorobi bacterium]|nr:PAS domain S-box protein [Chlorobiota bacterium]